MSCDHYHYRDPGTLENNNGQVLSKEHITCGAVMVDHASDYVSNFVQTSVKGTQKLDAKHKFETLAESCGIKIRHYHADNHMLSHNLFKESCMSSRQTQSFCGANTHHQNGSAERKIRTAMSLARAMMFNTMKKWPSTVHLGFWTCDIHYAVEILNNTPKPRGFAPKEIFTGAKGDR